jgi:hypothetical protein
MDHNSLLYSLQSFEDVCEPPDSPMEDDSCGDRDPLPAVVDVAVPSLEIHGTLMCALQWTTQVTDDQELMQPSRDVIRTTQWRSLTQQREPPSIGDNLQCSTQVIGMTMS